MADTELDGSDQELVDTALGEIDNNDGEVLLCMDSDGV